MRLRLTSHRNICARNGRPREFRRRGLRRDCGAVATCRPRRRSTWRHANSSSGKAVRQDLNLKEPVKILWKKCNHLFLQLLKVFFGLRKTLKWKNSCWKNYCWPWIFMAASVAWCHQEANTKTKSGSNQFRGVASKSACWCLWASLRKL